MSLAIWQSAAWGLWAQTAIGLSVYLLVLLLLGTFPAEERTLFYQLIQQRLSPKKRKTA
jgi:hypothetical protein